MIRLIPEEYKSITVNLDECIAKTETLEDGTVSAGMTVQEHCELTGFVTKVLIENMYSRVDYKHLFLEFFPLYSSLHDIGKVSASFQKMIYGNITDSCLVYPSFLTDEQLEKIHHTKTGAVLAKELTKNNDLSYLVGAHHGKVMKYNCLEGWPGVGGKGYENAAKKLIDNLCSTFESDIQKEKLSFYKRKMLLGLITVSDWISSSVGKNELNDDFHTIALKRIKKQNYGLPVIKKGMSFEDVFGFKPRKFQTILSEAMTSPGLYIVEAEMGNGKTEAALYAAYESLCRNEACGIYFALPTRVTSLNLYERFNRFCERINIEYLKTRLLIGDSDLYKEELEGSEIAPGGDWFDSRKRSILSPFGVGTVDQALMSVVNVKHSAVRTFGLTYKVVILDEIHSYDIYTGTLIRDLIDELMELGCSVIVLSATLQSATKKDLIGDNPEYIPDNAYPLITVKNNDGVQQLSVSEASDKVINVIHEDNEVQMIRNAVELARDGQYVLYIENTVEEAQKAYKNFAAILDGTNQVCLIHSRFTAEDRKKHEDKWVKKFGKGGNNSRYKEGGCILVGTQVLEQSLDIDADVLFTCLAPVDMLLQRMGRVWRHNISNRPCSNPSVHILHPSLKESEEDEKAFGKSSFIYSPYVLYRTLREIVNIDKISIPSDVRSLVESVYSDDFVTDNFLIQKYKSALDDRKVVLKNLAGFAESEGYTTNSDKNPSTRYQELPQIDVLVIRDFDVSSGEIVFRDGTKENLIQGVTFETRKRVAKKLLANIVSVSKNSIDLQQLSNDMKNLLRKFIYIPNDNQGDLKILMTDLKNVSYNERCGLILGELSAR